MTLLQFALNLVLGILAYLLVRWIFAEVGLDNFVTVLVSLLVGIGVFFANFAARIISQRI